MFEILSKKVEGEDQCLTLSFDFHICAMARTYMNFYTWIFIYIHTSRKKKINFLNDSNLQF